MKHIPVTDKQRELHIEDGMRLLAKAGRRIDAAFTGKVVKRDFVIREPKKKEDEDGNS